MLCDGRICTAGGGRAAGSVEARWALPLSGQVHFEIVSDFKAVAFSLRRERGPVYS